MFVSVVLAIGWLLANHIPDEGRSVVAPLELSSEGEAPNVGDLEYEYADCPHVDQKTIRATADSAHHPSHSAIDSVDQFQFHD